jgi:DNA repair protein RadD
MRANPSNTKYRAAVEPRWYQTKIIEQARVLYRSCMAILVQLATGGGKTPTFCWIIQLALSKGKRVLVLAHRHELLTQCSRKLTEIGVPHGLISPNYRGNISKPVQVASIQTMVKRVDRLKLKFDLIVIDETHLAIADSYRKVLSHYPKAKILGVTGTASRLDGRGLGRKWGGIYDEIIVGPSIKQLISEGYLVPMRVFTTEAPDISGVRITGGEYNAKDIEKIVDKPKIVGDCVSHYLKYANGRPFIAFCCSVEHAQHTAEAFRNTGVRVVSLSGNDGMEKRAGVLADLEAGKLDGITNAQLYIEGLDIVRVSCIILTSPTNSLTRYLQSVGRGMRPAPDKQDCILLDHAGSVLRFGLPDDDREWTLAGREVRRKTESTEASVRICSTCFAATRAPAVRCSNCGTEFPVLPREVKQIDGELQEVRPLTPEQIAEQAAKRQTRIEQGRADSLEALIALGRQRGYQEGRVQRWAEYVWQARQKKQSQRQRA